jgi:2-alkenal reductase
MKQLTKFTVTHSLRATFAITLLLLTLLLAACSDNNKATATSTLTTTTEVQATTSSAASAPTTTAVGAATATVTKGAATTAPATSSSSATTDQVESNSVVGVVKKVSPAVVTIYNKAVRSGAQTSEVTRGIGSGVIISQDGYILTNAHVVQGAQGLTVAFNNGQILAQARLIGADTEGDIAIIKVDDKVPAVASFGDSSKLEVGETVVAIGAALGDFRNSVTKGVVSGTNRTIPGDTSPTVYIQTDAPINHGNSGGPLLNLRGEIIGINTAVVRSTGTSGTTANANQDLAEGLGFAIRSNTAKMFADQLIANGSVSRPYFGIRYQMITPAIAGTTLQGLTIPTVEGAWINSRGSRQPAIVVGSPADKAGLKEDDVITAIDGVALNDSNPLVTAILKYKPNDTINLKVQRGTQTLTMPLTLVERPKV